MQSVLSRIWTRVTLSISYDDNHYTTGTSWNITKWINTWDIPLVIYLGTFLKWTREEMDQGKRNLMNMHKKLHHRNEGDRLYVSWKKGGRWLVNIEDSVDASIQWLDEFIEKHEIEMITDTKKRYRQHEDQLNDNN